VLGVLRVQSYIYSRRNLTTCGRSTELATANALESAANNFFIEYGALPKVGSRVRTDTPEGVRFLKILLGVENTDKPRNTRAIKFLSVREGKQKRNGLMYAADGKSVEGLYDPWGSPYTVILDTEDGKHFRFTLGSKTIDLKARQAAACSPGPDQKLGTADDVTTW